jgi:hypothetical protein
MSPAVFKLIIRTIVAAVLACPLTGLAAAQDQQGQTPPNPRVALVIGNSAYQHAAPIETATRDAAAMADSLTRLGFAVTSLTDADYDKTHRALLGFAQSARQASMAIVYFAGYGVEKKGEDYLVPVEADLQSDVEIGTISLHGLMSAVAEAKELGLVILEAGGGNSFAASASPAPASNRTRSVGQGLAAVEPKDDNILVAFAARPGTTAVERGGPHSVFTEALLNNIEKPGLEIQYLFRNVEADVRDATDQEQEAAHYGSLSEKEIFLKRAEVATNALELASTGEPVSTGGGEDIAWVFLRESTDVTSLRKFVERFPDGRHRAEAGELIARLEQASQTPAAANPANTAEIAWSILKERPTAAGLDRFVNAYRDSPHAQDALALLTSIEQRRQNPKSQQTEKAAPDIRFAVSHPVQKRRIVQRISRNDSNVEEAWQLVRTSRDPVVLRKFADDFPSRQYVSATHTRLAELGYDSRRPANLSPRDAAAYSLEQCDKLAGGELAGVSRDAVDSCRQALAAHPDIPRLQFQLCQCLIKDGRHQEASGHCGTAAQMAEAKGDETLAGQSHAIQSALLITDGNSLPSNGGSDTSGLNNAHDAPPAVAGGNGAVTSGGGSSGGSGGGGLNGTGGEIKQSGNWKSNHHHHFHFFSLSRGSSTNGTKSSSNGTSSNGTKVSHFRATNFRSTHLNGATPNVNVTTPTVHLHTVTANVPTPRTPTVRVRVPNVPIVNIH